MKAKRLLTALGELEEQYIEEALPAIRPQKRKRLARWTAAAAAALLIFLGTVGTAMAMSPQFRRMVYSFFRIEQAEPVPPPSQKDGAMTQSDIGGRVSAKYIRLEDNRYDTGFGTLHRVDWSEDGSTIKSVRFWAAEDELVMLDTQKSSFTATWQKETYQGEIYWCNYQGEISLYANSPRSDNSWYANSIPGRTDAVLLYLSRGRYEEHRSYPMLYHLDTGETEDILQAAEQEELTQADFYDWSGDLGKVIFIFFDDNKNRCFYYDVRTKTLTDLAELTGINIRSAFFADDDTLLLLQAEGTAYSVFAYDPASGQLVQTLDSLKAFDEKDGILFFGARYGLYVEPTGELSVTDLKTGTKTPVSGFTFTKGGSFLSNRSNTKFLYSAGESTSEDLGIAQLGVLDLTTGIFTAFDRKAHDSLCEWSLGWFDDDRAEIRIQQEDAAGIYLYGF